MKALAAVEVLHIQMQLHVNELQNMIFFLHIIDYLGFILIVPIVFIFHLLDSMLIT